MITLVLCRVTVATVSNGAPRTGYQLFNPADAPEEGRIATIRGSASSSTIQRIQCAPDEPEWGDVLRYCDQFVEVHEVDWLFVP